MVPNLLGTISFTLALALFLAQTFLCALPDRP